MKETTTTQQSLGTAGGYEAPRMTVITMRSRGSLLTGSMLGTDPQGNLIDFELFNNGNEPNNAATEYEETSIDQGWGDGFF